MMLTERERDLFSRFQPAGYILFSRNIADYEFTRELTDELRSLTEGADLPIIAVDQEGGRVVRTSAIGVEHPSASALAATANAHLITQSAYYTAQCLQTLGINTVFAPVLDLASQRMNALPGRCWGDESQGVTSWAGIWNRAFFRTGVRTCGKHFPGMGAAACDPHYQLPVLHGSKEEFLSEAAIPFTALAPELPSMMIAHLLLPEIDPDFPSSLSSAVVQGFLRDQLGYEGVVFTDDLCMGAISHLYTPAQSAAMALRAGCDLPLICHHASDHLEAVADEIYRLPEAILEHACARISRFRLLLETCPSMTFLEWDDYLRSLRQFNAKIPSCDAPAASSPVHLY